MASDPSLWVLSARLISAGLLTALLGLEREFHHKHAGLRTHALVGFGSSLVMIISQYGYNSVLRTGVVLDPSRTAAQVVSGIGFLGAGLIFMKQDRVNGLTTAAGVWVSAAVGLAAGSGNIALAAIATAFVLFALYVFGLIERIIRRYNQPK